MEKKEITVFSFNEFLNEGKLMGSKCPKCGAIYLPPHPLCMKCQNNNMEWFRFSGTGKLVAFTVISVGPTYMISKGFDRLNPYCTGIVQLDEGPNISSRIIGFDLKKPESIKIGTNLVMELQPRRENESMQTQIIFKPLYVGNE
jgi:uncharacterized OB-fold protein